MKILHHFRDPFHHFGDPFCSVLGSSCDVRCDNFLRRPLQKKKAPFLGNRMPIANGFAYRFGWIDMNLYVSQVEVYLPPTKHANCK